MSIRLTDPANDRYHRLRLIRWWDQEKLKNGRALIVGAGALGNEVAKNLALLGFGEVWIADFDTIETSNLTRSALFRQKDVGRAKAELLAERSQEMNADSRFHGLHCDVRYDLGLAFVSQMDVIFGCLDNREARYFVNRVCYLTNTLFIDGGLDTLNGSVTVFQPPRTACYECTLNSVDRQELQKRISCLKSIDPEVKQHVPTSPTVASLIGGLQVQIAVRAIHGLSIPAGKRLGIYGLSDVFFDIQLEVSDECGLHTSVDPLPRTIDELPVKPDTPLNELLRKLNAEAIVWDFDRDLVTALHCSECGKSEEFAGTISVYTGNLRCGCGGIFKPETTTEYTGTEPWGTKNFLQLGFPKQHIYCARTAEGRKYFRMIE